MIINGKIELTQDNDSCQKDGYQTLKIEIDDAGGGPFLRLKTGGSGWSFNHPDDLHRVIRDLYGFARATSKKHKGRK
jgi:hypothetical protein